MKLITAIIKPARFDNVQAALEKIGVANLTAAEVQGIGRGGGRTEMYRGMEYAVSYRTKIRLEVPVDDDQLELVIEAISNAAHTGIGDDGRVFITPLDQAIRIRNKETCETR
jgi:nitrogen regulatory protein PII